MAKRRAIHVEGMVHQASGSSATQIGPLLISGLIRGRDLKTNELPESAEEQAQVLMENIAAVMKAAGGTIDDIVKVRFFVEERDVREKLNPAWNAMFPDKENSPSRHVHETRLGVKGTFYEAEIVAYIT